MILLFGAGGLVLLIACVNVANLLLSRERGREIALRQALGAAPSRLIRQLLTESLVLSFLGGILGLCILFGSRHYLLRLIPENLPRLEEVSVDWSVLAFYLARLFRLWPDLWACSGLAGRPLRLVNALNDAARTSTGSGDPQCAPNNCSRKGFSMT